MKGKGSTIWEQSSDWFGRTIAIVILMLAPGYIGNLLDQRFGTTLWMPLGFAVGVVIGVAGLLILAQKLTPAIGDEAPLESPSETGDQSQSETSNSHEEDT